VVSWTYVYERETDVGIYVTYVIVVTTQVYNVDEKNDSVVTTVTYDGTVVGTEGTVLGISTIVA
jgi:hypothetical protein